MDTIRPLVNDKNIFIEYRKQKVSFFNEKNLFAIKSRKDQARHSTEAKNSR